MSQSDVPPEMELFSELEFLGSFSSELTPGLNTSSCSALSCSTLLPSPDEDCACHADANAAKVTQLVDAAASYTVDITGLSLFKKAENDVLLTAAVGSPEKTSVKLSSLVDDVKRDFGMFSGGEEELSGITSPVSLSAVGTICGVERMEQEAARLQSAEVMQTASPSQCLEPSTRSVRQGTLVLRVKHNEKLRHVSATSHISGYIKKKQHLLKQKAAVHQSGMARKIKKYEELPYKDPELEKTRRNAVNAKLNRERRKQEMKQLMDRCAAMAQENQELSAENKRLTSRLASAEEDLSRIRRELENRPTMEQVLQRVAALQDPESQAGSRARSAAGG